jgi:hypothetical protein
MQVIEDVASIKQRLSSTEEVSKRIKVRLGIK